MNRTAVITGYYHPKNKIFLQTCLTALQEQTYGSFDIYIYNNTKDTDALKEFEQIYDNLNVITTYSNLGFSGGNNAALRVVIDSGRYKYVALLNDDTKPNQEWLKKLVNKAESDSSIGAVASKLIFFEKYVRLKFSLDNKAETESIKFISTKFRESSYDKFFYREGFSPTEADENGNFNRTQNSFVIDVPVGDFKTHKLDITLDSPIELGGSLINLQIGDYSGKLKLKPGLNTYMEMIPHDTIKKNQFDLIQNASSGITAQFQGYDIGCIQKAGEITAQPEIDNGQYDKLEDAEMFCGGAVLLRVEALKEVGIFDPYFFNYYEDADLSLRIKKADWRIVFEPGAVVRHIHAGSSGEWSDFFMYHITKNRIAFVTKNFGIKAIVYVWILILKESLYSLKSTIKNFKNFDKLKIYLRSIAVSIINTPVLILKRFKLIKIK